MLAGGCYCGAVRHHVADEFAYAAYCHCSDCRRTTGSAFKPIAGIESDKLTVVDAPAIRPGKHIFVGSKAPWYDIADDLPQFKEF